MEVLAMYLLKSAGILALFYACYQLLLAKETFFTPNRHFLLVGVLTALVLPLLYLTKIVLVEPVTMDFTATSISTVSQVYTLVAEPIDWWQLIAVVYGLGVCFFLARFFTQLLSLKQLLRKGKQTKKNGFIRVEVSNDTNPFSFFNYIVYNPTMYPSDELATIIDHEKVHAQQRHSADMLLMHVLCAFQWFNPFVWLYKKAAAQNLEYIADAALTEAIDCKKKYQYLLLNQSKNIKQQLTIINPFFNSLIKKRIVMLNQQKSKSIAKAKMLITMPFLLLFLIAINTKTIAQTIEEEVQEITAVLESITVDKNSTDEELEESAQFYKQEADVDIKFLNIKRNSSGEIIAIKSTYKTSNGNSGAWNTSGDKPIEPFSFSVDLTESDEINSASYTSVKTGDVLSFTSSEKPEEIIITQNNLANKIISEDVSEETKTIETSFEISNIKEGNTSLYPDGSTPLYVIDGVEKIDMKVVNIDPNDISHINVLKDKKAKEKYGKKGKNGVVEITTKKGGVKASSSTKQRANSAAATEIIDPETKNVSSSFSIIIDKNSTNEELREVEDFFKKSYKVDLRFFAIKRNNKNEITRIKSKFKDLMGNSGTKSSKRNTPIDGFSFKVVFDEDDKIIEIGYADVIEQEETDSMHADVAETSIRISNLEISGSEADAYIDVAQYSEFEEGKKPIVFVDDVSKGTDYKAIKIKYSELDEIIIDLVGPKTTAKYGSAGKNGVIHIKTKKK